MEKFNLNDEIKFYFDENIIHGKICGKHKDMHNIYAVAVYDRVGMSMNIHEMENSGFIVDHNMVKDAIVYMPVYEDAIIEAIQDNE